MPLVYSESNMNARTVSCTVITGVAIHLAPLLLLLLLQVTEEQVWELFTQAGPVGELCAFRGQTRSCDSHHRITQACQQTATAGYTRTAGRFGIYCMHSAGLLLVLTRCQHTSSLQHMLTGAEVRALTPQHHW